MLLGINLPIYSSFLPALAGIRVMLQIMPQFSYQVDKACISRYSCNVTLLHFLRGCCFRRLPALAGIRVMLRQKLIYCHYQLRSLKVAKPVLNEH